MKTLNKPSYLVHLFFMKVCLIFLLATIVFTQKCYSQKTFDLKIILDSTIVPQEVSFVYFNGVKEIFATDTFFNSQLAFKENFFSEYPSFQIRYNHDGHTLYSNTYFINESPASLSFYYDAGELKHKNTINIKPVFDTTSNKLFGKLLVYRRKEARAVDAFFSKNGYGRYDNDSLQNVFAQTYKAFTERTVSFLKNYSEDYFSFWYFTNQVIPPSIALLGNDSAFLKYLLTTVESVFPDKYINNPGGKYIVSYLYGLIHPYLKNKSAPLFIGKDMSGSVIDMNNYKGKCVLLDFWATWCGPCMEALPFIKKLRNDYPANKLEIIGINRDLSFKGLQNTVTNKNIKWRNIWDENDAITNLFGVTAIPTTILINKEGIIIYRGTGITSENEEGILEVLNKNL